MPKYTAIVPARVNVPVTFDSDSGDYRELERAAIGAAMDRMEEQEQAEGSMFFYPIDIHQVDEDEKEKVK